jgi:heme exporter protein D
MTSADRLAIGLWIAAIVVMLWLAWEPWRQTRRQTSVDLSDDAIGRPVSPLYVFTLPAVTAAAPFVALAITQPGPENVWRHPHLLLPLGAIELVFLVVFQAYFRRQILTAVRKHREARDAAAQSLNAGRKS